MPYNQVSPPLMHSLLDPVSEPKKTQVCSIQPYSAGPAELSVQEPAEDVSVILMVKSFKPIAILTTWSICSVHLAHHAIVQECTMDLDLCEIMRIQDY